MTRKVKKKNNLLQITVSLSFACIFLLSGCAKKKDASNSPIFVLEQIKKETEHGEMDKIAIHFCEKDKKKWQTAGSIGEIVLGKRGKILVDFIKKQLSKEQNIDFEQVVFKNEKITAQTATVELVDKQNTTTSTIHFIKENGTWKICKP